VSERIEARAGNTETSLLCTFDGEVLAPDELANMEKLLGALTKAGMKNDA
jgi:hypothetical protein